MSPKQRIEHVEQYLAGLRAKRDEIVNLLMWEICKNSADAAKEVDRTIKVRFRKIVSENVFPCV
jgi:glyceraldehyde-3-phosphate dehydrogenase (NADP+)